MSELLRNPGRLLALLGCVSLLGCAGARERATERAYAIALDPVAFERGPGSPWQDAAEDKRFDDAAALVEAYIEAHGPTARREALAAGDEPAAANPTPLDAMTERRLHLVAARLRSCADDHSDAIDHLRAARAARQDRVAPAGWNAFLRAVSARLVEDRGAFEAARSEVVAHAGLLGDLDGFVREVEAIARAWQRPWCSYPRH